MLLLTFGHSFGQEPQTHWLVGRWDGNIDGFSGDQDPARTLEVDTIAGDGTTTARWSITGRSAGRANLKVTDSNITLLVLSSKSVVDLVREGDDALVGKIKLANGMVFPIKFTKRKPGETAVLAPLQAEAPLYDWGGCWVYHSVDKSPEYFTTQTWNGDFQIVEYPSDA